MMKKPQETLDWFKASGIKYFVISKPIDDPNYPKELYQIQLKLAHFALDNLKFIASSKDTYILLLLLDLLFWRNFLTV